MSTELKPGDRVTWKDKGKPRSGTVESFNSWSHYAYVKPDTGNRQFVGKARLTRVVDTQQEGTA